MSERKVLNKYIPPNFDPEKIPKRHRKEVKQHTVRLMAPFSMRCNSCGEYIYKGRKFNARKETVHGEDYLGIRIYRFYIRCPTCAAEITYKTDPKNTDYQCEFGAKRNFEPWREEKAEEEKKKSRRLLEEEHNPMKALENKTFDSKRELDIAEALDEIRSINARLEQVDADAVFERITMDPILRPEQEEIKGKEEALRLQKEREEDDAIIRAAFQKAQQEQEEQTPYPEKILSTLQVNSGESLLGPAPKSNNHNHNNNHNNSNLPKKRLDPSALGIVPKKKPQ